MPAPFPAYYVLLGDGHRWGAETGAAVGSPVTITYSFPTKQSSDINPAYPGWAKFNPTQVAAAREALDYIESFTNITFREVSANTGKLQFDNADLGDGIGGKAPHAVYGGQGGIPFAHVYMNNRAGWRLDDKAYVPGEISKSDLGGAAWQTLIHEIAHTLGLKHPHDVNDAGDPGSIRPAATDDLTVSTMSYTGYKNSTVVVRALRPDGTYNTHTNTLKPTTFGMDDIAALQYLYGTNTKSKGNNTYTFASDKPIFMTISDNGPNNTIDVSALKGLNKIDLNGGTFSDLAIKQTLPAGTIPSGAYDGTHALAIAYSAKVANVIGGSGEDLVRGNEIANTLFGKNGNDQLIGGGGADNLYGGLGADRLVGDDGFDYARYDDANYGNLVISLANRALNTGAAKGDTYESIEGVVGGVGKDTITGDAAINVLRGGGGNDILNGGTGADTLDGGAGNDTVYVDNAKDKVVELANGGTDKVIASVTHTLAANVENLTLTGTAAINGTGNTLANVIVGNGGSNVIAGGLGNDHLTGGAGKDSFLFNTALSTANVDTIKDFSPADDTIRLDDAVFKSLATGALPANAFSSGTVDVATDAFDRIVYNAKTGHLFYDADGNGAQKAVTFAILDTHPTLTFQDFLVV